jgi:hypothetical protein
MKVTFSLLALFAAGALAVPAIDAENAPQIRSDAEIAKMEPRERPSNEVLATLSKRGCGPGCSCNAGYCECDICNVRGGCSWYYDGYNCNVRRPRLLLLNPLLTAVGRRRWQPTQGVRKRIVEVGAVDYLL